MSCERRRAGDFAGRLASRIAPSLKQAIWSGAYVGAVVPPPATSLLNAPQYLTGKVLGDEAAGYIKTQPQAARRRWCC